MTIYCQGAGSTNYPLETARPCQPRSLGLRSCCLCQRNRCDTSLVYTLTALYYSTCRPQSLGLQPHSIYGRKPCPTGWRQTAYRRIVGPTPIVIGELKSMGIGSDVLKLQSPGKCQLNKDDIGTTWTKSSEHVSNNLEFTLNYDI